ncbi:AfsR/SARP family transcriptional regulator [Nonomuraea longicatena]|uniref:OmpR/PhoB-type domain-containing protein n=1 Tax=Nonomuraea longicatena TaxID=83682 RepID=A0ABN1PDZ3_9ACTN
MFRVLGSLEITAGDRLARVPGPRQRELLALLLLRANRVVTVSTMIELAWGERPPPTARRQAQNCVGRVRRLITELGLPPETIVTTPGGYLLAIGADRLDMLAFRARVHEGRALAGAGHVWKASRVYRGGLSLWRGPAFADVDLGPFDAEARLLDELRLTAHEECLALEMEFGRHGRLVPELAALVAEHPLRERLWGQLMLALYRAGRRAEALAVYQRARERIRRELGTEPGRRLRALRAAIARDEPLGPFPWVE